MSRSHCRERGPPSNYKFVTNLLEIHKYLHRIRFAVKVLSISKEILLELASAKSIGDWNMNGMGLNINVLQRKRARVERFPV